MVPGDKSIPFVILKSILFNFDPNDQMRMQFFIFMPNLKSVLNCIFHTHEKEKKNNF